MFKFFVKYLKPYIALEVILLFLLLGSSLLALVTPYVLKIIIDDIIPQRDYNELVKILLILVSVYVVRIVSNLIFETLFTRLNQSIINDIRLDLFSNMLIENRMIRKEKIGELVFILKDDVENIQEGISSFGLKIANNGSMIIGITIMLFLLNTKLTLLSLTVLPIIIFSTRYFLTRIKKAFSNIQIIDAEIHDYFFERLKNIRVILSYNTIDYELKKSIGLHNKLKGNHTHAAMIKGLSNNITGFFIAIGPLFVLLYGGKQVLMNIMTLGSLIAFMQYLNKLYNPMLNLINGYNELEKTKVSMTRVHKYFTKTPTKSKKILKNEPLESLHISDVSFAYGNKLVLNKINMEFKKGKIHGIIGASGTGKSTLIDLICGFIEPDMGEILFNKNHNVHDLINWHSYYALIEKENQLFSTDIISNVKYGNFDVNANDVKNAIRLAQLEEVIERLEFNGETKLTNNCTSLSDGQKQRISISRALLKKPKILIIDEATSSLDPKTEEKIFYHLKRNCIDSLIIFVTHRPSSLKYCDNVYELKNRNLYPINCTQ